MTWGTARHFVQIASILLLVAGVAWAVVNGIVCALSVGGISAVCPLGAAQVVLATRHLYLPLLIALVIPVLLTLFMGRVFCGWICPVNTVLELWDGMVYSRIGRRWQNRLGLKAETHAFERVNMHYVLGGTAALAALGHVPAFCLVCPVGGICRGALLGAGPELAILPAIALFEGTVARRAWCRSFCPLGALYVWLARLGSWLHLDVLWVHYRGQSMCAGCMICEQSCPMGLKLEGILGKPGGMLRAAECTKCGVCMDACPHGALGLVFKTPAQRIRRRRRRVQRGLPALVSTWGAVAAGVLSLAFPWYRVDFALRTFHASYVFGGLSPAHILRSAGRIQYEFYGVSAFWTGREEVLFRGLGWFSVAALGGGLVLALLWFRGASRRFVMAGIVSLLLAVLIPLVAVASLPWTIVAPAGETVTVALTPLPVFWLAVIAAGLLALGVLAEERSFALPGEDHHGYHRTTG